MKNIKKVVFQLVDGAAFDNHFLAAWIRFQINPTKFADPLPNVFAKIETAAAEEFFEQVSLPASNRNIKFVKSAIDKSHGRLLATVSPAIRESHDKKWNQVIGEYLNSNNEHLVQSAIIALTDLQASEISLQKSSCPFIPTMNRWHCDFGR